MTEFNTLVISSHIIAQLISLHLVKNFCKVVKFTYNFIVKITHISDSETHFLITLPISLRQPHLSLGQFHRVLKHIYLTVSAGPSDFLFLGADYK